MRSKRNIQRKTIDRNRYIFQKAKTQDNRVIHKVRKIQHQNPEFGHTQGEILKKNLQKSTLAFNGGMKNHQFWW
jgi:hypothetical protein